ncbi:methyl-accepting chemotaxis protein [Ruminiclostridium cellobioparum]|uniref:methyl-accepting chemotaxis protein n=1 Tax=Ruminiclostridium cellobioparum TaxID=29355 RepID=UPI0028A89388|nr:methyl-accepting chemotaxis protein [Ruminiclostridium cellobioparum]
MKLRIGVKILFSFSIVTVLIILVSVIGFSGMNSLNRSYEEIVNVNLPVETLVKEVRSINLEQVAAARGYIIYKDEQYPTLFRALSKQLEDVFKKIEADAETPESREYLKSLKKADEEYSKGVEVIFNYVREGKIEEAVAYGDNIRGQVNEIKEITSVWSAYVNKMDAEILKQTDKDMKSRILLLIIMIAAAIFGAIVIGINLTRIIARPVKGLTEIAGKISEGDLTQTVPETGSGDEISELGKAFSLMVANLRGLIVNVNDASQELVASSEELAASSEEVSKVSEQIATAVSELATGASEQAILSEKGNAEILETVEGLSRIAEEMAESNKMMEYTKTVVNNGEALVKYQEEKVLENNQTSAEVSEAITELSGKSAEIGKILEVIRGIADQTNLLALNAAIEAARAGEAGKSFSVVADEIRKLAEQSSSSVKQIDSIIKQVQASVGTAVAKMDKSKAAVEEQTAALENTVSAFNDIAREVDTISGKILLVAEASEALSKKAVLAGDDMTGIASVAQQTAASTQEVAASAEEQSSTVRQITDAAEGLSQLAVQLQESISRFQV